MKRSILDELDSDILATKDVCGKYPQDRIYGGEETALTEFPWNVLLEYDLPYRLNFHFNFRMYLQ